MSQRERQASGGVTSPAPRPAGGLPVPSHLATTVPPERGPGLSWEEVFANATPAQQQELLALAFHQGVLSTHQLPAPANGQTFDHGRQLWARLLAGQVEDLAPVAVQAVEVADTELDAAQREAVARAVAAPDVCLIQGLPGTGKSRVVAEVIAQVTARGEHVLLLAPTAAAIDRLLEAAAAREGVLAVRCLGKDEPVQNLPPASAACTFAERVRHLRETVLEAALRDVELRDRRIQRRGQDEQTYQRFEEMAARAHEIEERVRELTQGQAAVAADVHREAETLIGSSGSRGAGSNGQSAAFADRLSQVARTYHEQLAKVDGDLAEVRQQIAKEKQKSQEVAAESAALRPLAEVKRLGRWWAPRWWRATWKGSVLERAARLDQEAELGRTVLAELTDNLQQLDRHREQIVSDFRAEQGRLAQAEIARRQAELTRQAEALGRERAQLQDSWLALRDQLDGGSPYPADMTPGAASNARQAWQRLRNQEEREAAFARDWVGGLQQSAASWRARLLNLVNLVAGTTTAITSDPHFGNLQPQPPTFDWLILEEAHQLGEAEFLSLARRARRCVLVGEPEAPADGPGSGALRRPNAARPGVARQGFFHRLWQHLHTDPSSLPYAWEMENNRLCCRLRSLTPDQRRWLESERVADFPDIELRILTQPQGQPLLAEVVFPPSMSVAQAKAYIYQELEELPVKALGQCFCWVEEPHRLVLHLTNPPASTAEAVDLEPGVRELVTALPTLANGEAPGPLPWYTCCLEFDKTAGWHRQRAVEWVHERLGVRDLGRTIRLDRAHRMHPDLAAFLSDVLYGGAYQIGDDRPRQDGALDQRLAINGCVSAVEFVPVPPLERGRSRPGVPDHGPSPGRSGVTRRGGAGLELDLADPRHRERLPPELRQGLPDRGWVNLAEAQAVVRTLAAIAGRFTRGGERPLVGVVALYPAQAELIRRLIRQTPGLAQAPIDIQVDVPSAFRGRECQAVLVSLTRSHTHRAVSFGEGPHLLCLGLTRARSKLILFGDPGTLARRGQWQGPLEQLDEAAAARERVLIGHLLDYLNGNGPNARAFHLHEGGPP